MKILSGCVLALCVAGALSGILPQLQLAPVATVAKTDTNNLQQRAQATQAAKNTAAVASGKAHGRDLASKDGTSSAANSNKEAKTTAFTQDLSASDDQDKATQAAASKGSSASFSQNAQRSNAASKSGQFDKFNSASRQYSDANNNHEDVDYAYDKKFDLNDNQNGAYVFTRDDATNARDNLYDRNFLFDRTVGRNAASSSAADKQASSKSSSASAKNAANQKSQDKFGRDAANSNAQKANQNTYSNKQDASNQALRNGLLDNQGQTGFNRENVLKDTYSLQNQAGKVALTKAQPALLAPYYQNQGLLGYNNVIQAPALLQPQGLGAFPNQAFGANTFGQGLFAAHNPGYSGYGNNLAAGNVNQARELGANGQAVNQGAFGLRDQSQRAFSNDQWLNAQDLGRADQAAATYNDHGFNFKDANTAQAASQTANDKAAAAMARQQDLAQDKLDEDVKLTEAARHVSSDRDAKQNVQQHYFDNKNRNGNNWERLTYDRDVGNDMNGFVTQDQRDKALQNEAQADRLAQASGGKQADASRADQAQRDQSWSDSRKTNKGANHAAAAQANDQNASQHNLDQRVYKAEQAQKQGDNLFQNQGLSEQQGANAGFLNNGFNGYNAYPSGGLQGGFAQPGGGLQGGFAQPGGLLLSAHPRQFNFGGFYG